MGSTRTYYVFTFLKYAAAGVTHTLYIPMLSLDLGLTYAQIATVNGVFWATIILSELPTGMLADGRGRGWSVAVGSLFGAASGFTFALAQSFEAVMLAEALVGVSFAFFSGALTSWVADAPDRTEQLTKVYARATMIGGVGSLLAVLLGAQLAALWGRWFGFLLMGFGSLVMFIFALVYMQGNEPEKRMKEFEALKFSARHLRSSVQLRWVVMIQFLAGAVVMFNLYWTLFALTMINDVQLSYAWVPMYLAVVVAGWLMHRFAPEAGKEGRALVGAFVLIALPLLILRLGQPVLLVLAFFMVHELGRGAFPALTESYVDHRVRTGYRATFKSLKSFVGSLGMLLTVGLASVLLAGKEPDPELIPVIWSVTGAVMLGGVILLWLFRPREA
ncbi:MAG: MFS transporter [Patescibacteria group bacterium]